LLVAASLLAGGIVVFVSNSDDAGPARSASRTVVPVEAGAVVRGVIEDRQVFSGSLQAASRMVIAPKVESRIVSLPLDIGDVVTRGQVVATLEREEFEQLVAQAEADLAVAQAGLTEAESAAEIATREFERLETLHADKVISDSEFDQSRAEHLADTAAAEVARARVRRAEAALASTEIELGYTTLRAEWISGDDQRLVAERYAEEGDTLPAGEPALAIIELDPIEAVFYATEKQYARLTPGQEVSVQTDAFPGESWAGRVARVAPIFREGSRQARIEVEIPNPDARLKPGMFGRVGIVLSRVDDAHIVPYSALTTRQGSDAVFVIGPEGIARRVPVRIGVRDAGRAQVLPLEPGGAIGLSAGDRVVTLGQQLLDDETAVEIVEGSGLAEGAEAP